MSDVFTFSGFDTFFNGVPTDISSNIKDYLNEKAIEGVAEMQSRTPVDTGTLRRSEKADKVKKSGNSYEISFGSSLDYANYVEEGHYAKNGTTFVNGRHMLKDTMTLLEDDFLKDSNKILGSVFK